MHDDIIRSMRAAERLRRWARQGTWRRMAQASTQAEQGATGRHHGFLGIALQSLQGWNSHGTARSH